MAFPSVTYTFTTATTADPSQINTNFNNIINGLSDGSKDLNIYTCNVNGGMTVAGTATHTGAVTVSDVATINILGNGSASDVTISSGSVTPSATNTVVNGEAGAADNLNTIVATAFSDGDIIILSKKSTSGDITVRNGAGNITCGSDRTLGTNSRIALMYCDADSKWHQVMYAAN